VKKGDFFYLPAGTIHSIGKGILLLEVQQNSGITYRVWDWDRADEQGRPRELHVEKALRALHFGPFPKDRAPLVRHGLLDRSTKMVLAQTHPSFNFEVVTLEQGGKLSLDLSQKNKRGLGLFCLEGSGKIKRAKEQFNLRAFETLFVPVFGSAN